MCHSGDVTDPASTVEAEPAPINISALLGEALSKSDMCWIRTPEFTRLVWHAYDRDAILLVTGPGEQQIPPLPENVEVVLRSKDAGTRLLTVEAKAVVLPPEHEMWPVAAAALAAERLNATDDQIARWRETGTIYVLHPFGMPIERPGSYAVESATTPLVASRETTGGRLPAHVGGRFAGRARRRG